MAYSAILTQLRRAHTDTKNNNKTETQLLLIPTLESDIYKDFDHKGVTHAMREVRRTGRSDR